MYTVPSPVLKSSTVEFDNYQNIFVRHFASQSILTKGVLAKYRSFLWNWTPSHIQRIYKGQNSENPLRAITFDWSVLRNWGQRLWATFLMLFSGIPHLPTLRDTWHVTYVTHAMWQKVGKWGIPEKSIKNVAQRRHPQVRRTLQSKVMDFLNFALCKSFVYVRGSSSKGKNDIWPKHLK